MNIKKIPIDSKIKLKAESFEVFKTALQGFCQNGESSISATNKAFDVVRLFVQESFNEEDNTFSFDLYSGVQKIELLSGKKIAKNKIYHVQEALEKGVSPKEIISLNPDLFETN